MKAAIPAKTPRLIAMLTPIFSFLSIFKGCRRTTGNAASTKSITPEYTPAKIETLMPSRGFQQCPGSSDLQIFAVGLQETKTKMASNPMTTFRDTMIAQSAQVCHVRATRRRSVTAKEVLLTCSAMITKNSPIVRYFRAYGRLVSAMSARW